MDGTRIYGWGLLIAFLSPADHVQLVFALFERSRASFDIVTELIHITSLLA